MIQVNHLSFSYTKQPFIQDMNFSVGSGEIFGFLGPSGAGKSTLQKILLGMLPNYQGSARVNKTECKHRGSGFAGRDDYGTKSGRPESDFRKAGSD